MTDQPLWPSYQALASFNEGSSASGGLAAFREAGGRIGNQAWYQLWNNIASRNQRYESEFNKPLGELPVEADITDFPTGKARGYMQQVLMHFRDRETGELVTRDYSTVSRDLMTRQAAIDEAMSNYTPDGTDGEKQQFLGAFYASTYRMQPRAA